MARTWAATCYIVVSVARYVDPSGRVVSTARSFTRWPIRWPVDVSAELLVQIYGLQADPPSKATRWWVIAGANVAAVDCSHRRLPVARRYDGHPSGAFDRTTGRFVDHSARSRKHALQAVSTRHARATPAKHKASTTSRSLPLTKRNRSRKPNAGTALRMPRLSNSRFPARSRAQRRTMARIFGAAHVTD